MRPGSSFASSRVRSYFSNNLITRQYSHETSQSQFTCFYPHASKPRSDYLRQIEWSKKYGTGSAQPFSARYGPAVGKSSARRPYDFHNSRPGLRPDVPRVGSTEAG